MQQHRQRFLHEPERRSFGDCHRTALACLLNLPPEEVPHFAEIYVEKEEANVFYDWRSHEAEWLADRGYGQAHVAVYDLKQFLSDMDVLSPNVFYILGGKSPRGWGHSIICKGGAFHWDPHPDSTFVTEPMDHGCYEASFLIPLSMSANDPRPA